MFIYPARNASGPTIIEALAEIKDEKEEGIVFYADDLSQTLVSFSELYERVSICAENFKESGLEPGDRVGLVVPKTQEFVVCFLGALAARLVPVPMYPPFSLGKLDTYVANAATIRLQPSIAIGPRASCPHVTWYAGILPALRPVRQAPAWHCDSAIL